MPVRNISADSDVAETARQLAAAHPQLLAPTIVSTAQARRCASSWRHAGENTPAHRGAGVAGGAARCKARCERIAITAAAAAAGVADTAGAARAAAASARAAASAAQAARGRDALASLVALADVFTRAPRPLKDRRELRDRPRRARRPRRRRTQALPGQPPPTQTRTPPASAPLPRPSNVALAGVSTRSALHVPAIGSHRCHSRGEGSLHCERRCPTARQAARAGRLRRRTAAWWRHSEMTCRQCAPRPPALPAIPSSNFAAGSWT